MLNFIILRCTHLKNLKKFNCRYCQYLLLGFFLLVQIFLYLKDTQLFVIILLFHQMSLFSLFIGQERSPVLLAGFILCVINYLTVQVIFVNFFFFWLNFFQKHVIQVYQKVGFIYTHFLFNPHPEMAPAINIRFGFVALFFSLKTKLSAEN